MRPSSSSKRCGKVASSSRRSSGLPSVVQYAVQNSAKSSRRFVLAYALGEPWSKREAWSQSPQKVSPRKSHQPYSSSEKTCPDSCTKHDAISSVEKENDSFWG